MNQVRHREAGLTLVELLVTLVVAGLVTSSTFLFFASQKQVYEGQTRALNMQQNLWGAMETLTRNVRAAGTGFVGCVRPDPDNDGQGVDGVLVGDPPPGTILPAVDGAGVPLYLNAPATGLRARHQAINPPNAIRIPPMWIADGGPNGSDVLTVAFGDGTSGNFVDATIALTMGLGLPTAPLHVRIPPAALVSEANSFVPGEFVVVLDNTLAPPGPPGPPPTPLDRGCTLFQVTATDVAAGILLRSSVAPNLWNPPDDSDGADLVPFAYTPLTAGVRNLGRMTWIQFFVRMPPAVPVPTLVMQRLDQPGSPIQVLAEGIEDLQISYACDTQPAPPLPPDGALNEGTTVATRQADEWIFNVDGEPAPTPACNRPKAVRLTLIARSLSEDDTLREQLALGTNFRPAVENRAAGAADLFRRRRIHTTVFPRN